jgi:hypothetical protein
MSIDINKKGVFMPTVYIKDVMAAYKEHKENVSSK